MNTPDSMSTPHHSHGPAQQGATLECLTSHRVPLVSAADSAARKSSGPRRASARDVCFRHALALALLPALGCSSGSGSSSGGGGSSSSGGMQAAGKVTGLVEFVQGEQSGVSAGALFNPPDVPLPLLDVNPKNTLRCAVADSSTPPSWSGPRPQAGTIVFTGGNLPSGGISVVPDPGTGSYGTVSPNVARPFDDGMSLHVAAAGGSVPAFDTDVAMPRTHDGIFSMQLPYGQYDQSIDRTAAIYLSWSPFDVGQVEIILNGDPETIWCAFDGSKGFGAVTPYWLNQLPPTESGHISIRYTMSSTVVVGQFTVRVDACQEYGAYHFTIAK
jgi:hypothetical protein